MTGFTDTDKSLAEKFYKRGFKYIYRGKDGDLIVSTCLLTRNNQEHYWRLDLKNFEDEADYLVLKDIFEPVKWSTGPRRLDRIFMKQEILDQAEKNYLENIIRPFIYQVVNIEKTYCVDNSDDVGIREEIDIRTNNPYDTQLTKMPPFKAHTMYRGMENGREYTLDELGLFKDDKHETN